MKKIFAVLGIICVMFIASGCGGNDYQHPSHRSGAVK